MMCNVTHGDVLMHARTVCVHAVCASYVLMCMCLCMRARFVHDCCFFFFVLCMGILNYLSLKT